MIALFVGRFQPFHIGHLDALMQIQEKYDLIKLGIGSAKVSGTDKNPFDIEARKKMIESIIPKLKSKIEIYEIPDINDDKRWVSYVKEIVGDFDIVYSGNDYVLELFSRENIPTKKQTFNIDINATRIREMIRKGEDYSEYVTEEVREIITD